MLTKMTDSPSSTNSCAATFPTSTTIAQPAFCTSPTSTAIAVKRENSPRSPTQESLSKKRARNRHVPYLNNKSPTGSCSSSDESNENDAADMGTNVESRNKRLQANSRERKRMHTVNSAFDQLRELVPTYPTNRKLSKIDTLRLACTYIQDLVSVLHQTRALQGMQGDEMAQFPVYGESYSMPGPYSSCFNVKTEAAISEYPAFTNYRMPSTCMTPTCDSDYSNSETETHSPPYLPPTSHSVLPAGIAVRPPPLSRTSSDSAAHIHRQMAHATVSVTGGPIHSQAQRHMTIPSPLATHAVQHTTPQPLVSNELGIHHSPPVWQRCGSMPAYPVYGQ